MFTNPLTVRRDICTEDEVLVAVLKEICQRNEEFDLVNSFEENYAVSRYQYGLSTGVNVPDQKVGSIHTCDYLEKVRKIQAKKISEYALTKEEEKELEADKRNKHVYDERRKALLMKKKEEEIQKVIDDQNSVIFVKDISEDLENTQKVIDRGHIALMCLTLT